MKSFTKYINKRIVIFIFIIEIIGMFLFLNNGNTQVIIEVNNNQLEGNLQLYYAQTGGFIEGKSVSQKIGVAQNKVEFIIPVKNVQKVRMVLYSLDELNLAQITVISNGVKMVYDASAIYKSILLKEGMEINSYEEYIELKASNSRTPYIDFGWSVASSVNLQLNVLIIVYFSLLVLLFFLAIFISLILNIFYEKIYSNHRLIKILLTSIVILAISTIDYRVITKISDINETFYEVKTHNTSGYSVLDEEITTSFRGVSNKLLSYKVFLTANSTITEGKVEYQLINSLNEIIYEQKVENIEEIYSESERTLNFMFNSEKIVRGELYQLVMRYSLDTPIEIEINSDGIIHGKQILSFHYQYVYFLIIGFINLIAGIYIIVVFRKGFKDKIIVSLAIVIGIILCFVIAPCNIADEFRHFVRAYDISQGNFFPHLSHIREAYGNVLSDDNGLVVLTEVPDEINQLRLMDVNYNYNERSYEAEMNYGISMDKFLQILLSSQSGEKVSVSMAATSKISILSYLPQVLFMWIGKILGFRPIVLYYIARIGNVIVTAGLFYIVLRLLPKYKKVFAVLYFTPYFTILRSSCSTDGLLIILVLMELAYIIKIKEKKEIITIKKVLIILALTSYIACMKLPYCLVCGCMLIFSSENYKISMGKKKAILFNIIIIFIVMCISFLSYHIILDLNNSRQYDLLSYEEVEQIAQAQENKSKAFLGITEEHISYIIEQPKAFFTMIFKEYLHLSRYRVAINGWDYSFGILYILLFLMLMLDSKKLEQIYRLYFFMLSLAIWSLIFLVGYRWAAPNIGYIWGVSGKYLIPILPIVAFALPHGNDKTENVLELIYPSVILFSLFGSLLTLFARFWT